MAEEQSLPRRYYEAVYARARCLEDFTHMAIRLRAQRIEELGAAFGFSVAKIALVEAWLIRQPEHTEALERCRQADRAVTELEIERAERLAP